MNKPPYINKFILTIILTVITCSLESSDTVVASPIVKEMQVETQTTNIIKSISVPEAPKVEVKKQEKKKKKDKPKVKLSKEDKINKYVDKICDSYGVAPELIKSMIFFESTYNPKATNGNCKGLMQVSEYWHKDRMKRLGVTDLYDPYGNVLVGVDFVSELIDDYEELELVLMLYNMKRSTAFRDYKNGNISDYAIKIIKRSQEMKKGVE